MYIKELKPFMPLLIKSKEIWLVGGAVRDYILGLPLSDFDFAVNGSALKFARWFAHQIKGAFVLLDEERDEARVVYGTSRYCRHEFPAVSGSRKSGDNSCNGGDRKKLTFDFSHMENIEKDLARRDFTLNAIALKLPDFKILDPYNGRKDIKNKLIRMISERALLEDPLRILRGFRFKATLGFKIHPKTLVGARLSGEACAMPLLKTVAKERIREEFFKILGANTSYQTVRHMAKLGLLQVIIPETKNLLNVPQGKPSGNLLDHSLLTLKKMEKLFVTSEFVGASPQLKLGVICDKNVGQGFSLAFEKYFYNNICILKLASLLHDIGKPKCYTKTQDGEVHFYGHEKAGVKLLSSISKSLRLSNSEYKILSTLTLYHMRPHLLATEEVLTDRAVWRLVRDAGENTPGVLLLAYADMLASGQRGKKRLLNVLQKVVTMWEKTHEPKFKRLVTGDDLIKLGLKPGPKFKKILQAVEEAQVSGELNNSEEALQFVKRKFI